MSGWKRKLAGWAALALIAAAGIGIEVAPTLAVNRPDSRAAHVFHHPVVPEGQQRCST